jgi:gliding motility-associated-like protein
MMHSKSGLFFFLCFLSLGLLAQPVNDDCVDAISVPVSSAECLATFYTTAGAGFEATDPNPSCWLPDGPDNNVWFSFIPTTAAVEISTYFDAEMTNTQVAVYSGTCGAFTELACQEDLDAGFELLDAILYLDGLTPGTTYYLMVDGNFGQTGTFGLCIQEMIPWPEPAGDDCPEAVFLCTKDDVSIPDGTGSDGLLEEVPSCFGSGEIATDWFTFTAANTGSLTFDIAPLSPVNFDWAVYDISMSPGSTCDLSDEFACNSVSSTGVTGAGCGGAACTGSLSLIAGHTYALVVNHETAAFSSGYTLSFGGTANFQSPVTDIEYDSFVCVGENDAFEIEGPGDGMYFWSFGDGATSTDNEPDHIYANAGTYEVVFISYSPGGCYAVSAGTVIVSDGPELNIFPEDPVICLGEGVTLDLTVTLDEECVPSTFIMDEGFEIPEAGIISIPIIVSGVTPVITADMIESVCINVEHTSDADLDIWLECPDGTTIELSTDNGGTGDNYDGTCFVPSGASSITTGTAPFLGTYLPEQPFSDFAACPTNGVWYIVITDDNPAGELGSIEFASIAFACDSVPESIVWSPATGLSSTTVEDPFASPGVTTTYTVTVTDVNGCSSDTSITVTVTDGVLSGFVYPGSPYCIGDVNPLPVLDAGASPGSWSASPPGVVIDAITGEIDLSLSIPGTYTITNYVAAAGSCPDGLSTYDIVIDSDTSVFISAAICSGETYLLPDGTLTSDAGIFFTFFLTTSGCDSTVIVDLSVNGAYAVSEDIEICDGGTYTLPDGTVVSTSGTYLSNLTSTDGCDSTITTNLLVSDAYLINLTSSICSGDTYVLPDGSTTSTDGLYSFTFTSTTGCDSVVTVDLTVNSAYAVSEDIEICDGGTYTLPDGTVVSAAGTYLSNLTSTDGCDSIITTNLLVSDAYLINLTSSICSGDTYVLPDGSTTSTDGLYSFTFTSAVGCDSVVTVDLTVNSAYAMSEDIEICDGGTYTLPDGTVVSAAGTYLSNLTSTDGCDSTITTNLLVSDAYLINLTSSICSGDTYVLPDGSTTSTDGLYSFTFTSAVGCDSVVTVDLTVNSAYAVSEDIEICDGGTYTLPDGTVVSAAGTYLSNLTSIDGCDSTITTNLLVSDAYLINLTSSICSGDTYVLPDGSTTSTDGLYSFTFTSAVGCDSVVTVDLTVNSAYAVSEDIEICDGGTYTLPDGTVVSTAGTYLSNLTSTDGCDSTITTNLLVSDAYLINLTSSICSGDTYVLPDGSTTSTDGLYSFTFTSTTGCDSVVTVDLTVNSAYAMSEDIEICDGGTYTLPDGTVVSTAGTYLSNLTSTDGCDSIITTNLIVSDILYVTLTPGICEDEIYILPDGSFTSSAGTYTYSFISVDGCDSLVTVDLSVHLNASSLNAVAICDGEIIVMPDGSELLDPVSGIYDYTFATIFGCDSLVSIDLTVYPTDSITLSDEICAGEFYLLPDGSTTSVEGTYYFSFINMTGCDSSITVLLDVSSVATTIVDTSVCYGEAIVMPDGSIVTDAGTYAFLLATIGGCDSNITVNLTVSPLPIVDVSMDNTGVCQNGGIQVLTMVPPGGSLSGAGITGEVFDPGIAGAGGPYIIQYIYTDALGCSNMDSVEIEVFPIPVASFYLPTDVCIEATPLLLFGSPTGGVFVGDGVVDSFLIPSILDVGLTDVMYIYTDLNGCTDTSTASINVQQNYLDAGPDETISLGDSLMLFVDSDGSLTWSPALGLSCIDCFNPIASPLQTTVYLLTEIDANGCLATDLITIYVENADEYTIFIPNTFTPNGDLSNDYFMPYGYNIDRILSLQIYDRWGFLMYHNEDIYPGDNIGGWDGTFKGKPVNAGVYAYIVEFLLPDGSIVQRGGNVTLLR